MTVGICGGTLPKRNFTGHMLPSDKTLNTTFPLWDDVDRKHALDGFVRVQLPEEAQAVLLADWPARLLRLGGARGLYLKSPFPRVTVRRLLHLLHAYSGLLLFGQGLHGFGALAREHLRRLLTLSAEELEVELVMAELAGDDE